MIPRIIHHVWLGEAPLPERFQTWRFEMMALHPEWEFRFWHDGNVAAYLNCPKLFELSSVRSSHSNMVRMEVVFRYGGIYVDCDCEPVRAMDPLLVHKAFAGLESEDGLCSAVFGAEAGHPWLRWQVSKLPAYARLSPPWGPSLMSEAPRDGLTVLPQEAFYPWLWRKRIPSNPRAKVGPNTYLIHHWARSWQTASGHVGQ